jgi:7-keto-8-aminopelargonate synthetase-like enzyme
MNAARLALGRTTATTVEVEGREVLSFAGCNYLGLAHDPSVVMALHSAIDVLGISAGASRQTTGTSLEHEDLERELARFLRTESALLVSDGYMTNLAVAQAIVPGVSRVLVDAECHVSIRDALAAVGIVPLEYEHADARSATTLVAKHASESLAVFTDGVFPSRGTIAPIREILARLPRDATLVVDDCHATGVLGESGRGTCEHLGISDPRVVITSTLSKALGCYGGFIAAKAEIIELIRSRSRAFAGSTPIPPAIARAARAALGELSSDPGRIERLRRNITLMRNQFKQLGLAIPGAALPVFAFTLASESEMQRVEGELLTAGFLVPCVSYPDQPGRYMRLTVSAEHTANDIDQLATELGRALRGAATR